MSIINLPEHDIEKFQNELTSIAIDGSRKWIYARQLLLSLSCLQYKPNSTFYYQHKESSYRPK